MRPSTDSLWTVLAGGFFGTIIFLMGGIDDKLTSLAIMMVADYLLGVTVAIFIKKDLNSKRSLRGIIKKVSMLIAVIVAVQVDVLIGNGGNDMRNGMIFLLCATEGISVTENLGLLGVPVPKKFYEVMTALKGVAFNDKEDKEKKDDAS